MREHPTRRPASNEDLAISQYARQALVRSGRSRPLGFWRRRSPAFTPSELDAVLGAVRASARRLARRARLRRAFQRNRRLSRALVAVPGSRRGGSRCFCARRPPTPSRGKHPVQATPFAGASNRAPDDALDSLARPVEGLDRIPRELRDDDARNAAHDRLDPARDVDRASRSVDVFEPDGETLDARRELAQAPAQTTVDATAQLRIDREARRPHGQRGPRGPGAAARAPIGPRDGCRERRALDRPSRRPHLDASL